MGLFSDLLDTIIGGPVGSVSRNSLGSVVRAGISEGMSGNAIQTALKGSGIGIRRGDLFQLIGEMRSSLSAGEWAQGVDPKTIPTAENIKNWTGGTPGKYLTRINTYRRVKVGPGEYQVERRGLSFLSNEPLSPAQAMQNATDLPIGHNGTDPGDLLGYEYNGTYLQRS